MVRKRRSSDEYKEYLTGLNDKVDIIGKCENTTTPILVKCKFCGREWEMDYSSIKKNCGCKYCSNKKITTQMLKDKLNELYGDYIHLISNYESGNKKLLLVVGKDIDNGIEVNAYAKDILRDNLREVLIDKIKEYDKNIKEYEKMNSKLKQEELDDWFNKHITIILSTLEDECKLNNYYVYHEGVKNSILKIITEENEIYKVKCKKIKNGDRIKISLFNSNNIKQNEVISEFIIF